MSGQEIGFRAHGPEDVASPPLSQSSRRGAGGGRGTIVWQACATCRTYGASDALAAICAGTPSFLVPATWLL